MPATANQRRLETTLEVKAGTTVTAGTDVVAGTKLKGKHVVGTSGTPTIVGEAAAGTAPTVTVTGTDLSGFVELTVGVAPGATGDVLKVTLNTALPSTVRVVIFPRNERAATAVAQVSCIGVDASNWRIQKQSGAAWTATEIYQWNYIVTA